MNCVFCRSTDAHPLRKVKSPVSGEEYSLYECRSCRSCFFLISEHEFGSKELHEDMADGKTQDGPVSNLGEWRPSRYWKDQVALIARLLGRQPQSVLDIGCGTGDFLLHFDKSVDTQGIELAEPLARIAEQRGLRVYDDFVENIEFPQKYDVITGYAVFEHFVEPRLVLEKLSASLNPGGLLVIMVPTFQSVRAKLLSSFGGEWHMYAPPGHLNFYSRKFLDTFLQEQGLSLVHRRFTTGGLFNPIGKIPILRNISRLSSLSTKAIYLMDHYTPFNRVSVFDHMYSYYQKQ